MGAQEAEEYTEAKLAGDAKAGRDDVRKLKQSKKNLLKKKEHSRKTWAEKDVRKDNAEKKKMENRTANIEKLRAANAKRKKARQGFEGSNQEVLPRRDVAY